MNITHLQIKTNINRKSEITIINSKVTEIFTIKKYIKKAKNSLYKINNNYTD